MVGLVALVLVVLAAAFASIVMIAVAIAKVVVVEIIVGHTFKEYYSTEN